MEDERADSAIGGVGLEDASLDAHAAGRDQAVVAEAAAKRAEKAWTPTLRPLECFGCEKALRDKAIRLELGGEPRAKSGRRGKRRGATVLHVHARCQRAALDRWIKARVPA